MAEEKFTDEKDSPDFTISDSPDTNVGFDETDILEDYTEQKEKFRPYGQRFPEPEVPSKSYYDFSRPDKDDSNERFTDEEKCLMELYKSGDVTNLLFTDADTFETVGVPYFQNLLGDTVTLNGVDDLKSEDIQKQIKDAGSKTFRTDICSKLNEDEATTLSCITSHSYVYGYLVDMIECQSYYENYLMDKNQNESDVQNYKNMDYSERSKHRNEMLQKYGKEDIDKILNGEPLDFTFGEYGELIPLQNTEQETVTKEMSPESDAREKVKIPNSKPALDDDLKKALSDTYGNSDKSMSEIAREKGLGDDVTTIFDCNGSDPDSIKAGYKALLAYQERHPNENACMVVDKYAGVRADSQFTDNGVLQYMGTMFMHFGDGCMLFPEDKEEAWYKCCNEQMNNGTNGCNLDNATDIAVALAEGKPFNEVAKQLNQQDFADGSKDDVMSIMTEFAPKGQDFADYLQQNGHEPKGRGDEKIVKDETQDGHDDDQPGGN